MLEHTHAQRIVIFAVAEKLLDQLGFVPEAAFLAHMNRGRVRFVDDQIDLAQIQH